MLLELPWLLEEKLSFWSVGQVMDLQAEVAEGLLRDYISD
jgi:hypothetical protein